MVKKGQFVKADKVLAESGETSPVSGLVTAVNKGKIQIRNGRPYLISPGTMLQIDSGALVLRGDLIATLVFEREKQAISFKVCQKLKNFWRVENLRIVRFWLKMMVQLRSKLMMMDSQDCSC